MPRRSRGITFDPPYDRALDGTLAFADFESLERCIRSLDELLRSYRQAGDKKGMEYCREVARLGRRRSEIISRNRKVNPAKRAEKAEMAFWFRIWLESPDIFADWVTMRRATEEFGSLREPSASRKKPPRRS